MCAHKTKVSFWEEKMLDFGYYNMDCMQGMKEFPDKYFDLAIVDPPFGGGQSDEWEKKKRGRFGGWFDKYHIDSGDYP